MAAMNDIKIKLDPDTRRVLRNLTTAINRLARANGTLTWRNSDGTRTVRLSEPERPCVEDAFE